MSGTNSTITLEISMDLDGYFQRPSPDAIRIAGTRLGVETVLYDYIHRSRTAEQIAEEYQEILRLDQVYATILYYLLHRVEMDTYLARWLEREHALIAQLTADPGQQAFWQRLDDAEARARASGQETPVTAERV